MVVLLGSGIVYSWVSHTILDPSEQSGKLKVCEKDVNKFGELPSLPTHFHKHDVWYHLLKEHDVCAQVWHNLQSSKGVSLIEKVVTRLAIGLQQQTSCERTLSNVRYLPLSCCPDFTFTYPPVTSPKADFRSPTSRGRTQEKTFLVTSLPSLQTTSAIWN